MKSVRLIIRAIVVAIAILGGIATTAYADSDQPTAATAAPAAAPDGAAQDDPSDPGLPPD